MLDHHRLSQLLMDAQLTKVVHPSFDSVAIKNALKGFKELELLPVDTAFDTYTVIGVDGSQVYPDRHMPDHGDVALINIGGLAIEYGNIISQATFFGEPELVVRNGALLTPELIDMKRDIKELRILSDRMDSVSRAIGLRDGTLSLGHLAVGNKKHCEQFLIDWTYHLDIMCQKKQLLASYMSAPRTSDLIQAINHKIAYPAVKTAVKKMTDVELLDLFVDEGFVRTNVFQCAEPLSQSLVSELRPSFFYLHVGSEWACIQIPGWIAGDAQAIETIANVCANQAIKGRGYPVVLAEAHEQAVIRGQDRELFYKMIEDQVNTTQSSQKSNHKQNVPV